VNRPRLRLAGSAQEEAHEGGPLDADLAQERGWVERLRLGDADALGPLFQRHAEALLGRIIRPRLADEAACHDILKETFLTAFERIEQFQWRSGGFGPWLRRIAINKVRDLHRTRGRHERLNGAYQDHLTVLHGAAGPDAEAQLSWAQEQELVQRRIEDTLKQLNPRYARAIRLRLVHAKSRTECAEALEVSVSTFDVVLFRAVRAFRKVWGPVQEEA